MNTSLQEIIPINAVIQYLYFSSFSHSHSHFDNVTAPLLPTIWWSSLPLLQDHWLQHLELNSGDLPWLDEGVAVPGLG